MEDLPNIEQEILINLAIENLKNFTDEARLEIFSHFCRYCGRIYSKNEFGCHCNNDE